MAAPMKRRGWTIRRRNGRGVARVMLPGRPCRFGYHSTSHHVQVSIRWVIVTVFRPGVRLHDKETPA